MNLSVQAQGQYHLRTAVDQRGDQTVNKDPKTVGGIKGFSGDNNDVTKGTLGRSVWYASKYLPGSIWYKFEKPCYLQLEFWPRNLYTWQILTLEEDEKNGKWIFKEKSIDKQDKCFWHNSEKY